MKNERKKNIGKRLPIVTLAILLFVSGTLGVVQLGVVCQTNAAVHWQPDYEKIDILPLLEKEARTEEDYAVLYAQTGLTKLGIGDLLSMKEYYRILRIQENYFNEYEVTTSSFAPFTYTQKLNEGVMFTKLRDGDIFISATAFTSWFLYGHSALVVNGAEERVLDAVSIWEDSSLTTIYEFGRYPNFLILRPRLDETIRKEVAAYAKTELIGLPYRLTTGIFSNKFEEKLSGTHCGHLVWYAYQKFGVDLDSTGGMIVTPKDIANSPKLEVVQSFGFDPHNLWR